MMPWWGFGDPFRWLTYFLAGATLDLLYLALWRWHDKAWLVALLGGLAHMTKPLMRVAISTVTGWPYGSLLWGVAYPAATHFVFGVFGALLGLGLMFMLHRRSRPRLQP
jgi:hypothetical protein